MTASIKALRAPEERPALRIAIGVDVLVSDGRIGGHQVDAVLRLLADRRLHIIVYPTALPEAADESDHRHAASIVQARFFFALRDFYRREGVPDEARDIGDALDRIEFEGRPPFCDRRIEAGAFDCQRGDLDAIVRALLRELPAEAEL